MGQFWMVLKLQTGNFIMQKSIKDVDDLEDGKICIAPSVCNVMNAHHINLGLVIVMCQFPGGNVQVVDMHDVIRSNQAGTNFPIYPTECGSTMAG